MSDDLESRLRRALRPVAPSEELGARLSRTQLAVARTRKPRAPAWWLAAGLAASLILAVGVQQHVHREQEREQGLEARREVIEALRVTSEKLDLAFEAAKQRVSSVMRVLAAYLFIVCMAPAAALAQANPRLNLPDFIAMQKKAAESVTITLDPALLSMATRFLGGDDPKDVATREILKGLQGIYVRSYTFNEDFAYRQADIDAVRSQLTAPGWNRLMQTRSQRTRADVDIYIMQVKNQAVGLALIASEPRQVTIVNIVGEIDLDKLHKLQGQFGVPKFEDPQKAPPPAGSK